MVEIQTVLKELGLGGEDIIKGCCDGKEWFASETVVESVDPSTRKINARISTASERDYERIITTMQSARREWASMPMPKRGDILRQIGDAFREKLVPLGTLISLEMGKIKDEGIGEVQEVVDICDFAVGLSRTLEGKVLPSERPNHMLLETWNPLGLVGIITAFNFPVAVLGWNAALSLVCGNCNIWKGADTTPLISVATTKIITDVLTKNNVPPGVFCLLSGAGQIYGDKIARDNRINLVSFTGSVSVGRKVSQIVHLRFAKCLLELSGNNASIIMNDADLDLAIKGSVFAAEHVVKDVRLYVACLFIGHYSKK